MDDSDFLVQIIILVGSATAVATVFHYLRIPTIVGFILSGMLVGPYGLGIVDSLPGISVVNEIGLALLMFTIGLEFSMDKLKALSKSLIGLGLGMIGGVIALTFLIGTLFDIWSPEKSIAIGMVLSLSSSAIVLKILQSNRELETPYGNASVGILLAQDLCFVPMLLVLPLLFEHGGVDASSAVWGTKTLYLTGACLGLAAFTKLVMPIMVEKILQTRSNELFFFMLLFLIAVIASGSHILMGSFTLGAFLAGLTLASSPVSKQALSDILPLRDMFLGILFTSVGMLVDLKYFIENLPIILLFVLIVLLLKPAIVYTLGRLQRYSRNVAMISALVTFQIGEFSIVMMKEIHKMKLFTDNEVQLLLALSVVTMALTPLIYKLAPKIANTYIEMRSSTPKTTWSQAEKPDESLEQTSGHTVVVGYGVAGRAITNAFVGLGIPYYAIEMNFKTVKKYKSLGVPIIFGDASSEEILHGAHLDTAKMLIITIPSFVAAKAVIAQARRMRPDIEIVVRVQYERGLPELKKYGEIDVVVAEYEVTLEILHKSLEAYGIKASDVRVYLENARGQLDSGLSYSLGAAKNTIGLPGWEATALIRPYRVGEKVFAVGKSLQDLHLRAHTGVSIATVYREGVGTTVPHADFILESGDIIHLVGKKEAINRADQYIESGSLDEVVS